MKTILYIKRLFILMICYCVVLLLFALNNNLLAQDSILHSDTIRYEKRSLAAVGCYVSEMLGVNYTMPEGFIDLKIMEPWYVNENATGRAYTPVIKSEDEECILMYALVSLPWHYNDSIYDDCCCRRILAPYHGNNMLHRNLLYGELWDLLGTNDFNMDDHISILPTEKARDWFNADSVFFLNIPLASERSYKRQYNHCTSMVVSKLNCPTMCFKWFFTEDGKKNERQYIEKLSKNVWYYAENVNSALIEREKTANDWFVRILAFGY